MHGLGNDFVVVDNSRQSIVLSPEQIRHIAKRRYGVGCDQLLLVEVPRAPQADLTMRIFNADGAEVEQCGNGARCIAVFARDQGLVNTDEIIMETAGGFIRSRLEADGQVSTEMGAPCLEPAKIPFLAEERAPSYALSIGTDGILQPEISIGAVSMGNPHAVLRVDDVETAPVVVLGARIQAHASFPEGVNVGFMEVVGPNHIRLRVYERGAGETLACGTGACAAVVVGREQALLDESVDVELPGGFLRISWDGEDGPVWMTGPATRVFEGYIEV